MFSKTLTFSIDPIRVQSPSCRITNERKTSAQAVGQGLVNAPTRTRSQQDRGAAVDHLCTFGWNNISPVYCLYILRRFPPQCECSVRYHTRYRVDQINLTPKVFYKRLFNNGVSRTITPVKTRWDLGRGTRTRTPGQQTTRRVRAGFGHLLAAPAFASVCCTFKVDLDLMMAEKSRNTLKYRRHG
ncbi:hypothetical protein EVAR_79732_1 [Eumeta japonica]|uniref:Uncharacterized protein n=1 Tax=Eumeta variegata TaxID=151549 RepID=A0A4C1TCB3_EUMVA|nr:hypothetical protein EVAR_79732_1 [Eumeta japonica]